MNTHTVFLYLSYLTFLFIFIEYIYSFYKKDNIYSKKGTKTNIFNGLILILISRQFILIYVGFFLTWYSLLNYKNFNFNITSLVVALLLVDFIYYIFHRLHHHFYFLWMFHHVHHGDDKLNLSTAYRISWVEQIYEFLFFAPILLIGINPILILTSFYILCLYQFICHSQYIKFPHFMSYIFITPQLHAVHHDQKIENQNSNFGAVFSIWDRMFGTYIDKIDSFTPGIKGYKQDNLLKIYTDPVLKYIKK